MSSMKSKRTMVEILMGRRRGGSARGRLTMTDDKRQPAISWRSCVELSRVIKISKKDRKPSKKIKIIFNRIMEWGWARSGVNKCRKLPGYVPYKGTYVPYDGIYGTPDQGQTLEVQEGQTAESALRDDWTRNVRHHTLEVVLEVILEHMCTGLRP